MFFLAVISFFVPFLGLVSAVDPFLIQVDSQSWVIGNSIWNLTIGPQFGKNLWFRGHELVGQSTGHYVSHSGANKNLTFTRSKPHIIQRTGEFTNIVFSSEAGDFHWVLTPTLPGAYQYFVNRDLPMLGEFRTLWRLDNKTFTHGWTKERQQQLPTYNDIRMAQKVQDETWLRADGKYITKYDLATFLEVEEGKDTIWGVYGKLPRNNEEVGSWYIHGGKEYLNGDHLKQELMNHRESSTGDTVQLNMIHGTHFQSISDDKFAAGRMWGPWLWYLNHASHSNNPDAVSALISDARARSSQETAAWPYPWMEALNGYNSRGNISGRIVLSDGRPASKAAIFLGDNHPKLPTLDQGAGYYYRTHANVDGSFEIPNVRQGTYNLQAWPDHDSLGDVITVFSKNDVDVRAGARTNLGSLEWKTSGRKHIWQIGIIDRTARGFRHAGPPHEHGRHALCPSNMVYAIKSNTAENWCFTQGKPGSWKVKFDMPSNASTVSATLSIALAAYSGGIDATVHMNDRKIGEMTQRTVGKPDPAIYRSGTLAGDWRLLQFKVPSGTFIAGLNILDITVGAKSNTRMEMADLKVEAAGAVKGFMYDSILLEQN